VKARGHRQRLLAGARERATPARGDRIHGVHAALAVFRHRPGDIERAFVAESAMVAMAPMLKMLAAKRRPYTVVTAADLERITESTHHEGVCLVVRPRPPGALAQVLAAPGEALMVGLPGVANPHNLGAILRSAAHFGARAVLVEGAGRVAPAAARVAQGGAEAVPVVGTGNWSDALAAARRAGFFVLATSSHARRSLYELPAHGRVLVLLGAEGEGLPPDVRAAADGECTIPGSGAVESLNVAAAAAVCLAFLSRQRV